MSYPAGSIADPGEYEMSSAQPQTPFATEEFGEGYEPSEFEELTKEAVGAGETPFVAGQAFGSGDVAHASDIHELLAELYDSEFDRHLLELSDAAAEAAAESPFAQEEAGSPGAERYLREWLEPLQREAESMLEALGEALADRDVTRMGEFELDELFAEHEPPAPGENPVFENFLGGLWKKAKAIVSGAVNLAKKGISAVGSLLPIGAILARLKPLVRPLLERVLQMALNRLPPGLRPVAEQLKRRFAGEALEESSGEAEVDVAATASVTEIQQEFDANAASLLLANDELDRDAVVAEAFEATAQTEDSINDLARAREQLVEELQALPAGGDPLPAVQNFIPAVMAVLPFVRFGISMIGRDRVVRFIAQFIAQMIRPYTGDLAPQLSQAIASTGLSLMSLEAPVDPRLIASTVLAGTVEDTVRRVAEQSDETLEHPELLEATVASAFDEAVAHHFPPTLLKPQHRLVYLGSAAHTRDHGHPHSHPHDSHRHHAGMWVRLPHARWYRKFTRPLTARITPQIARHVRVFGGATLETFLRDHYGITGEVVAAAHLYEALPGATLGKIAAHEKQTRGLGRARAYWKLQPLTPEIAGMLFGEPGLGRHVDSRYLASPGRIAVGERFYCLELHHHHRSRPGLDVRSGGGEQRSALKPSEVNVRVDLPRHRISVALHLSDTDAQELSALLRNPKPANVAKLLHQRLHDGLELALSATPAGHLHWIGQPQPSHFLAEPIVARRFARRLLGWAGAPLLDAVTHRPQDIISAADRRADGLTVLVHLAAVPPLHLHHPQTGSPAVREPAPVVTVEIVSGFRGA
jgi:hypothetical protein